MAPYYRTAPRIWAHKAGEILTLANCLHFGYAADFIIIRGCRNIARLTASIATSGNPLPSQYLPLCNISLRKKTTHVTEHQEGGRRTIGTMNYLCSMAGRGGEQALAQGPPINKYDIINNDGGTIASNNSNDNHLANRGRADGGSPPRALPGTTSNRGTTPPGGNRARGNPHRNSKQWGP
jgi:hypothetical protein